MSQPVIISLPSKTCMSNEMTNHERMLRLTCWYALPVFRFGPWSCHHGTQSPLHCYKLFKNSNFYFGKVQSFYRLKKILLCRVYFERSYLGKMEMSFIKFISSPHEVKTQMGPAALASLASFLTWAVQCRTKVIFSKYVNVSTAPKC